MADKLEMFEIGGVSLRIPADCLTEPLAEALSLGRYEHTEADALKRHLQPGDRVLDLGAGAGFLSVLSGRIVGPEQVTSVEANPRMIGALKANLRANGAAETRVIEGALVPSTFAKPNVRFRATQAFWAGQIDEKGARTGRHHDVPALRFSDLLDRVAPSVVLMDIEGAEAPLVGEEWPVKVRMLILEIHTGHYPPKTVRAIFDWLSKSGFAYHPWGSRAQTLIFQRF